MFKRWFVPEPYSCRRLIFERLEERIVLDAAVDSGAQVDSHQAESGAAQDDTAGQETGDSVAGGDEASGAGTSSDSLEQVFDQNLNEILVTNVTEQELASSESSTAGAESGPAVLVVASALEQADTLVNAAADGVVTVLYDAANDTPEGLLSAIEEALGGQEASSIAFATHDLGEGSFYLAGGYSVNLGTLLADTGLQDFWQGVGELTEDGGRIDILACDLASTAEGTLLISQLENITGRDVAASDDATGAVESGGDWILETDDVDLEAVYFTSEGLAGFTDTLAGEISLGDTSVLYSHGGAYYGGSVAIYEDTIVVGATENYGGGRGAVYVFTWDDATWILQAKLTASDGASGDYFGWSVDIYEDTIVVGAPYDDVEGIDMAGSAYVFTWDDVSQTWTEQAKLQSTDTVTADDYGDEFGGAVAIYEDTIVVGAEFDKPLATSDPDEKDGAAYVFVWDEDTGQWAREARLASDDGPDSYNCFATDVDIYGDTIIVGNPADNELWENSGAIYVYTFDSGTGWWSEQSKIVPVIDQFWEDFMSTSGEVPFRFGRDVSIYEDTILSNLADFQAVWVLSDGAWGLECDFFETFGFDYYDTSRGSSLYGDTIAVGTETGVHIFTRSGDTWSHQDELVRTDTSQAPRDSFGGAIEIFGSTLVVGAPGWDYDGTILTYHYGAAFVFEAPNQSPVLDVGGDAVFTAIDENSSDNQGDTVADLVVDGSITDKDVDSAPESIAVVQVDNMNGFWQYSTDNGATWTNFSDVIGAEVDLSGEAVLLDGTLTGDDTTRIRFVPNSDWYGFSTIQYRAWDMSDGSANGSRQGVSTGWDSPVSAGAPETAEIMVKEENYAPILMDIDDCASATGVDITLTLYSDDPNVFPVNTITYSAVDLPDGATLDATTGEFAWKPAADQSGTYKVTFVATDDGTGNLSDNQTVTIYVNDRPKLNTDGDPTFSAIYENDTINPGDTVADIVVDGSITDPNADPAPESIAVTAVDNAHGVWQYSTDNGETWSNFTDETGQVVYFNDVVVLDGSLTGDLTTKIRFVADDGWYGAATIQYLAWDMTDAAANGSRIDLGWWWSLGALSPLSNSWETASITVYEANDAPDLDSTAGYELQSIAEDTTDAANTGTSVGAIVADDSITDGDYDPATDAAEDILVTSVDNTNGAWQYKLSGGAWTDFDTTVGVSTLLTSDSMIRFVPDSDWNGEATFTFRAWDGTDGGSAGDTVTVDFTDAENSGGITAYSADEATATITVEAVNDTPIVTVPGDQTVNEDTNLTISGISVGDVDDALDPDETRQVSLSVSHGTITLASTAGISFAPASGDGQSSMTFTGTLGALNDALDNLIYRADLDFYGSDTLTVTINDLGESGAAGAGETASDSINIAILEVNDAPIIKTPVSLNLFDAAQHVAETGTSNTTTGSIPEIGRLIGLLSSEGSLPFSPIGGEDSHNSPELFSQFGILLHQALLGEDVKEREQAWSGLSALVSGNKSNHGGEEWLGLEEFFMKLREWQVGQSHDEIVLVFNSDEVKLAGWFNSLISSGEDVIGDDKAASLDIDNSVQKSLSAKAWVFDMADIRVADLLSAELGGNGFTSSQEPAAKSGGPVCRVFDLGDLSFSAPLDV